MPPSNQYGVSAVTNIHGSVAMAKTVHPASTTGPPPRPIEDRHDEPDGGDPGHHERRAVEAARDGSIDAWASLWPRALI
jgi:hypothetical protein